MVKQVKCCMKSLICGFFFFLSFFSNKTRIEGAVPQPACGEEMLPEERGWGPQSQLSKSVSRTILVSPSELARGWGAATALT